MTAKSVSEKQERTPSTSQVLARVSAPSLAHTSAAQGETKKSLWHNSLWSIAGSAVFSLASWLTVILFSKLGNSEMLGRYSLALAIVSPIVLFTGLQLRSLVATDVFRSAEFGDYLGFRLLSVPVALLMTLAVLYWGSFGADIVLVTAFVLAAKMVESTSEVFYGIGALYSRMDRVAKSQWLRAALSLVGLVVGLRVTGRLDVSVAAFCVGWTLVLVVYDIPRGVSLLREHRDGEHFRFRPRLRKTELARITRNGLPLALVATLAALGTAVPRYFIEGSRGVSEVGIYSAILTFGSPASALMAALALTASPRFAEHYAAGKPGAFSRVLAKLLGVTLIVSVFGLALALLWGKELLTLVYRAEYAHSDVFCWAMVLGGIGYLNSVLGAALTAMRQFWIQLPLSLVQVAVLIVCCAKLVPSHGMLGAVMANIIAGSLSFFVLSYWVGRGLLDSSRHVGRGEGGLS